MLYLMRHGQAGEDFPDDIRALTRQGEEDVLQVSKFLKNKEPEICSIWHSPLKRACQTAALVSRVLSAEHGMQMKHGFSPNDSAELAVDQIEEFFMKVSHKSLFIVSHLPLLPQIVEILTCKSLSFPTSSCLYLRKDEKGHWIASEMFQPTF